MKGETYGEILRKIYKRRDELGFAYKIALAFFFAFLTALSARIKIPLPFTPVPITGQTFVVLLSGFFLEEYGPVSQAIYVGLGLSGAPWFAFGGGPAYVFSPTFGYLLGFVAASAFIGVCFKGRRRPSFWKILAVFSVANFLIIYGLGVGWLYLWFQSAHLHATLLGVLEKGAFPFIPGDLLKMLAAAGVAYSLRRP